MLKLRAVAAVGCCAALTACGTPAPSAVPSHTPDRVSLPRPELPWDEDFAAHTELDRITVGDTSVLLPTGIRLPDDARVASHTEATVVLAEARPDAVVGAVTSSAVDAGYEVASADGAVQVWVGHGMAVRLEAHRGAQVLAWAPEDRAGSFAR